MRERRRLICLDFDGVIHLYPRGWSGESMVTHEVVPGAIEFMYIALHTFRVAIYSVRSSTDSGIRVMKDWLDRKCAEDLATRHIRELRGEWWADIEWPRNKPSAFVTLDDRSIQFNGTFPTIPQLVSFRTWTERERL